MSSHVSNSGASRRLSGLRSLCLRTAAQKVRCRCLSLPSQAVRAFSETSGLIEAAVAAFDESSERAVADLAPLLDDLPEPGELREDAVVVGERGGRYLMPRRAP